MLLLLVQIVNGINIILFWSIIGGFSESCIVGEFYDDLKSGKLNLLFFIFLEKLLNFICIIEVGCLKNDLFDCVKFVLCLVEEVFLIGCYI